ncbi:MAG: hypothetical protein V2I33_25650, partial [Kangiellaceae bacterium]|nr:hypothetical protein [Kangiellaceae bacterium]
RRSRIPILTTVDDSILMITALLCSTNNRMIIRKTYKFGTGDPHENFGHTVLCQLRWSETEKKFRG